MQARGRTAGTGRLGEPGAEGVGGAAAVITAGMRLHGAEWDLKSLREAARRQGLAAWPGRRQLQGAEDRGGCCCVRGGSRPYRLCEVASLGLPSPARYMELQLAARPGFQF